MRKSLLFVALLIVSQVEIMNAQSMFEAPDTVCVRQPIQLTSNVPDASTHYWGFCSAYLRNNPTGTNLGKEPWELHGPTDIEVVKDGDKYYGFVVTAKNNAFIRLDYGTSLHSTPVVTDYGTFDNALPFNLNSLYPVKDSANGNWHIFVSGGSTIGNSEMARIDFGSSLGNVPNIVNFGNFGGVLDGPHGIFVAKEADKWYGFCLNKNSTSLVRFDMDTNISLTPMYTNLGPIIKSLNPHDLAAVRENGEWYFFVTNSASNDINRIHIGPSLNITTVPPITEQENPGNQEESYFGPSGISFMRDCDDVFLFVTNRTSHELVRVLLPGGAAAPGLSWDPENFGIVGAMAEPAGISKVIRDRDDVFAFVPNFNDSTITRVLFPQCTNASITSSTTKRPPAYSYNAQGYYNVYYAVNEGTPDMMVHCKQIAVLPIPPMVISNDTTICQGDTISLKALSTTALNITWSPEYNLSSSDDIDVRAWPQYTVQYRILLPYSDGCIVDTAIDVTVHKVKADAGPDRDIADGAATLVGGPFTSTGPQYAYNWHPAQYIDNPQRPNATVRPPYSFTYYLEVTDSAGCRDVDTVIIRTDCANLTLPNAFAPKGGSVESNTRTFGLINSSFSIIKLNYFRIFDRWGKLVFETTDPTQRWDGTVNGEDAQFGVYVYDVDAFCGDDGRRIHKSGNVTLIR
jgi:gliding motility-associated-like protein